MWARLKHYGSVYSSFVSTSFSEAMSFRTHFLLLMFMDIVFYTSHLWSVDIVYDNVELIGPWRREQLLFFASVMLAINQLTMSLVSENYWRFPLAIRTGEFDFTLVKPINSVFLTFFRVVRPGSIANLIYTGPAVVYFGLQVGLEPLDWALLPPLIFAGFLLQNSIEMMISCGMFWMIDGSGVNFIRIELQQLARWPDFVYPRYLRGLLMWVLPILLTGSAPVRFIFDRADRTPLIVMLFAIPLFWALTAYFWQRGLKAYESASS
ncbi:MAG: ABC-2 family transporter protein [bacterium]|nr:ABC-2 family transporter protein [bacterium]